MKPVFVRDLPTLVNQDVTTFFLVLSKETRFKKSGEPYLFLLLGDSSGDVEARVWENVDSVPAFERDDFVKVRGLVQAYRNKPQLSLHKIRKAPESEVELRDFFRTAARAGDEMLEELRQIVAGVADTNIRRLLESILDDEEIAGFLERAPAAKTLHHAYFGGLLEHIVSLCGLAERVAAHYPSLDLDLLIAGAVLHDLGKIRELRFERSIAYSTEGHLLGHIVIGLRIIEQKIAGIEGFPGELRGLLEHLLISHHGEYEFGSPKLPMLPEAVVLHFLDDLDSKVNHMNWLVESDGALEGEWTSHSAALGRALLKRGKYLETYLKQAEAARAAAAASAPAEGGLDSEPVPEKGVPAEDEAEAGDEQQGDAANAS